MSTSLLTREEAGKDKCRRAGLEGKKEKEVWEDEESEKVSEERDEEEENKEGERGGA